MYAISLWSSSKQDNLQFRGHSFHVEIFLLVEIEIFTLAGWRCKLIFFVLKLLQKSRDTPICPNNLQKHHNHTVHSFSFCFFFFLVCWNVFLKRSFEDFHFVRERNLLVATSLEMGQWSTVTPCLCQAERFRQVGRRRMALQRARGILFHRNTAAELYFHHPALTPVCLSQSPHNSLVSFLWLHEFLSAEWHSLHRMDREHPHPKQSPAHWPESSPGRQDWSLSPLGQDWALTPAQGSAALGPQHVPCHAFPRAVVALDVQPAADPLLPNSPFASACSLSLLGPLWLLRADIPGVPSEFLLALMSLLPVLLLHSHWQEKEGAKQAFSLKLLCFKCWVRKNSR